MIIFLLIVLDFKYQLDQQDQYQIEAEVFKFF